MRPFLQEDVKDIILAGVEPDGIKEEAPGHPARAGPNQPGGGQNEQRGDDLVKQQDAPLEPRRLGQPCRHLHNPHSSSVGRDDVQSKHASRPDKLSATQAAQHRKQVHAPSVFQSAAFHRGQVQPVALPQSGLPCRRVVLCEGSLNVVDPPVVVRREAGGGEWLDDRLSDANPGLRLCPDWRQKCPWITAK
jgi:hypothetical protein